MFVDLLIALLVFILWILGVAGSLLPALPGPQLSYLGILILHFALWKPFSTWFLIARWIVVIGVLVLDYYVPIWGVKKFWGTQYGNWGSMIWLVLGTIILPFMGITFWPFGLFSLIWWPFIGAYLWEMYNAKDHQKALKSAIGSFIGFLAGTFVKIFVSVWLGILIVMEIVHYFF